MGVKISICQEYLFRPFASSDHGLTLPPERNDYLHHVKKMLFCLLLFWLSKFSFAQDTLERSNTITLFGGAEYGVDMGSLPSSSINFRDGFFHTAGFNFTHQFGTKWYLQPSVFYTQVLLSNSSRIDSGTTQKAHRLGIGLNAGYYIFTGNKWRVGVGGGVNILFNLAAVRWKAEFSESGVGHLTPLEMNGWGVEGGFHVLITYRFHPKWELRMSPFVNMNIKPVFLQPDDYSLRTGLNLGIGYCF